MKSRFLPVLCISLLAVACAGETADENMDADAAAESADAASAAMTADEAAIDQVRMDYAQHYNMHHPEVVADLYADSAVMLAASGDVQEGKEEILAGLQEAMGMSPTVDLTRRDMMVFGDYAMALGDYSLSATAPEGAAVSATGHYLTAFQRIDGAWKIMAVVTNYDTAPPEGMPMAEDEMEAPPEEGTMTDLLTAYETHFNLGHADMVADLFTDDATAAFGNLPISQGQAAIEAAVQQRFAMGGNPQLDIHDVYTMDLGDGWALDAGWYEITATGEAGPVGQNGAYISLTRQQADGSWKIHWMVSNGLPADG